MAFGELAEPRREGLVAVGVEVLLGEEDDPSLEPGPADGVDGRVVEVAEIDAADDGADRAGKRRDVEFDVGVGEGHRWCSLLVAEGTIEADTKETAPSAEGTASTGAGAD